MQDASLENIVVQSIKQPIQPSIHDFGERNYLTDGELLPWKNHWWRVHLRENDGRKWIELEMVKATATLIKRSQRAERWNEQHSKRSGVQRELRHLAKLWKSKVGGGASSGSVESAQALQ